MDESCYQGDAKEVPQNTMDVCKEDQEVTQDSAPPQQGKFHTGNKESPKDDMAIVNVAICHESKVDGEHTVIQQVAQQQQQQSGFSHVNNRDEKKEILKAKGNLEVQKQDSKPNNIVQSHSKVEAHKHLQPLDKQHQNDSQPNPQTKQEHKPAQPQQKQQPKAQQQQQGKKQKGMVAENHHRVNYLVQASRILATMPVDAQSKGKHKHKSPGEGFGIPDLASQTGSLASAIGRRCVMRLAPALKRTLCKGCGVALVFGVNAKVRHRSRRQKHLVVTCLTCRTIKRFVNDPKHKLWCEQKEALV